MPPTSPPKRRTARRRSDAPCTPRSGRSPHPTEPVARLWHAATLLREHRGDGHIAALVTESIGGTEAHVLHALWEGMPAEKFGRIHHLPAAQLTAVIDGMRSRGLVDAAGLTDKGRETKARIEDLTDTLAEPAYEILTPAEQDQLLTDLAPIGKAAHRRPLVSPARLEWKQT